MAMKLERQIRLGLVAQAFAVCAFASNSAKSYSGHFKIDRQISKQEALQIAPSLQHLLDAPDETSVFRLSLGPLEFLRVEHPKACSRARCYTLLVRTFPNGEKQSVALLAPIQLVVPDTVGSVLGDGITLSFSDASAPNEIFQVVVNDNILVVLPGLFQD